MVLLWRTKSKTKTSTSTSTVSYLETAVVQCAITFLVLSICLKCEKVKGHEDVSAVRTPPEPLELDQLQLVNFLVGIAAEGIRLSNGTGSPCARDLGVFLKDLEEQQLWALKIIDSFGESPKSISWGNYFWFTSKEFCEDLNRPYKISLSNRYHHTKDFNVTSPFPVRFWMVYYNFTTPVHVDLNLQFENKIHAGLCFPKSCTYNEVVRFSDSYFSKKIFEPQRRFDIDMTSIGAKAPYFTWNVFLNKGFLMTFSILTSLAVLAIMAEVIHRVHKHRMQNKDNKTSTEGFSRTEQFFLCFDIQDNYERMLQLENSKGFLPVIAGLRTIVCLWVTLFHVYFYSLFSVSNVPLIFAKLEFPILQPILQSCFYVDVFFAMSAFLLAYNFLSNTRNMQTIRTNSFKANVKFFLKMVLNRYVRLLPIMLVTVILSDCMFDFMDMFSSFRMDQYSGVYCKKNWWYNVFFINNFLDLKDICSSWTWYLGCEMQFFILFTLILFIYAKNESAGKAVFSVLLVSFLGISFLCNYFNEITFQIDVIYGTLEQLYVKPWVRVNPYFAGVLMGWLYFNYKDHRIQFTGPWKLVFWIVIAIIYLSTNFMSYWRATPSWIVAIIMSFGKLIFGLSVGCVIVMCEWGYGGTLNSLMSSRPFLFLNKFCFSIYMVAPVVVVTVFGLRTQATHFSEIASGTDFIGVIVLSILMAFILVLLVEIPFQKISTRFILRRKVT